MKSSNVQGHCQACGRIQVVLEPKGVMSQHGYKVRSGYFSGVCIGHDHLPLEVSREYLDWVVVDLERHAAMHDKYIVDLINGVSVPSQAIKRDQWNNVVYGPGKRSYDRIPVIVNWSEATGIEQAKQVELEIGESESEARFARGHAKSLLQLAAKVHGQLLIDREAQDTQKRAARAAKKAPIEGAFRTKAAQKDALESLGHLYSKQREIITNHYLSLPGREHGDAGNDVYYAVPFDLHQWRAKTSALVLKVFPSLANAVTEIERLAAARADVKSRPVIK